MNGDAEKWDARYLRGEAGANRGPSALLRELLPLLPRGHALDLAAGAGRNAVFLAAQGWRVTAVDRSRVALEKAEALSRQENIPVRWGAAWNATGTRESREVGKIGVATEVSQKAPGLWLVQADLEHVALPAVRFDLVVCLYYLERRLFPEIERALRPGGVLVYETYTLEQLAFRPGPRNPEHLLRPNELRKAFPACETLFYRELRAGKGIASLLARKPPEPGDRSQWKVRG